MLRARTGQGFLKRPALPCCRVPSGGATRHPRGGGELALTTLKLFLRDRSAATAVEYALVASMISIAIGGGLHQLGYSMNGLYAKVQAAVLGALG